MPTLHLRLLLAIAVASGVLSTLPLLLHMRALLSPCHAAFPTSAYSESSFHGDLRLLPSSWNHLTFSSSSNSPSPSSSSPLLLRIAVFVKKWPSTSSAGGLERHALTVHRYLAHHGHQVHVFTTDGITAQARDLKDEAGLHLHFYPPRDKQGHFDATAAWDAFVKLNASMPFDIVHSESVALPPARAKEVGGAAVVTWHGIAYECVHTDIVRELIRVEQGQPLTEDQQKTLRDRVSRVVAEVRFFPSYAHHVALSDYAGDVLRTIYQIPLPRLHIIVNGVDGQVFYPDAAAGQRFRAAWGVPPAAMVLGAAGRLVKDKGYPLLFDAFPLLLQEDPSLFLLIAGDGPWGSRFKALSPTNVLVLGPLPAEQLAHFYNAIDILVNPTLRAQGLDLTLLEAMLCGKPILATHFSSITTSLIVHPSMGYTFHPRVPSLLASMRSAVEDGRQALQEKGKSCYQRASSLFTATKMASAYERLFLCIKDSSYCMYNTTIHQNS